MGNGVFKNGRFLPITPTKESWQQTINDKLLEPAKPKAKPVKLSAYERKCFNDWRDA